MPAAYIRELLEHVRRDLCELCDLLHHARALDDLTVNQLAQAIGLADTAHRALLSAMKARHTEGPQGMNDDTDRAATAPPEREQSTIFRDHRCVRCRDGEKPCVQGHPNGCSWPHARND